MKNLPGTDRHREMLQTIADIYEVDERILAILLFGSLGRGDWDPYSDLDLDIVMVDNISIDARLELAVLCAAIKEKHGYEALIIANVEEGDVVLSNLLQFSIRYHVLNDTKSAILDTMQLLTGNLSLDEIQAGVNYAHIEKPTDVADIINRLLRYELELHNAIIRQRVWMAMEMFQHIRRLLMLLGAVAHGATRPIHFFDSQASPALQELLVKLSPHADLNSLAEAFQWTISVLEHHLAEFSDGDYVLTTSQKQILDRLKALEFSGES